MLSYYIGGGGVVSIFSLATSRLFRGGAVDTRIDFGAHPEIEACSTIEVHPKVSGAHPHLRSSIPYPKTDFQQKSSCIPMKNPMTQLYKNVNFRN